MDRITKFLKSSETPHWALLLGAVSTISLSILINVLLANDARRFDVRAAEVSTFVFSSSELNTLFAGFALEQVENSRISVKHRNALLDNITEQYSLVNEISYDLSEKDQALAKEYLTKLEVAQGAIASTNDFDDMQMTYQSIADLVDEKEDLLQALRRNARIGS